MSLAHPPRIDSRAYYGLAPAAVAALRALGTAVEESGLDAGMVELMKLRASQMNGCAFCVQHHLNIARKLAVPQVKLDLVATWREAGMVFGARECAALAWTEALTDLASMHDVPDAVYEQARCHFDAKALVDLTLAVITINGWNRLNVAFRTKVGDYVSPHAGKR